MIQYDRILCKVGRNSVKTFDCGECGMELIVPVLLKTALMFVFMLVGYLLYRSGKITDEGSKSMANLLVYIVMPAIVVKSFCVECTTQSAMDLSLSTALGLGAIVLSGIVAHLFFKRSPIDDFATTFCNSAFFGIPLIQATIGETGVFFIAPMIAFTSLGQWTYGVKLITGEKLKETLNPKKLLLSPFVIAVAVGLILFFSGLGNLLATSSNAVASTAFDAVSGMAAVNTPLAMVVIGVYLAKTDFKTTFTTPSVYAVCAVRLLVVPLLTLGLFSLVPSRFALVKLAVFISTVAPVGANVAVYAQLHGKDYPYAVKTVTASTIFSVVTMPLLIMLADAIWL